MTIEKSRLQVEFHSLSSFYLGFVLSVSFRQSKIFIFLKQSVVVVTGELIIGTSR